MAVIFEDSNYNSTIVEGDKHVESFKFFAVQKYDKESVGQTG